MAVEALRAAVVELARVDIDGLSDAELHQSIIDVQRECTRLAAVMTTRVSAWSARKTWADDRSKSAGARLARDAHMSTTAGNGIVRRARKLRNMPLTAEAFAAGEISADHVDALARCNSHAYEALFARDEAVLVEHARTLRWAKFTRALQHWLALAADHAGEDRATRQRNERRAFGARTLWGTVDVSALLDPVGGEIFLNELHRLEQQMFEADWADARARVGPLATEADLLRTAAQRRADALVEMAVRSAARPERAASPRPLITILWGADSFRSTLCETENGIVLSPEQVIPLLAEADIERIVFGAASRVLDVGVRERFFTGALRRAIQVRDQHCQDPSGCDVPAPDCEVDHVIPYSEGGLTTQDNGRLRCSVHNRTRHRRGPPKAPS